MSRGLMLLAAFACPLLTLAGEAVAHGGNFVPPPPPPPAPFGRTPQAGGGGGGGAPSTPGGESGGPSTGGGEGGSPLTGGGAGTPDGGGPGKAGPSGGTPGTGDPAPGGPQTGSGRSGPPERTPGPPPSGLSPDHWTQWWYRNRLLILDLRARVRARAGVVTPGGEARTPPDGPSELWREEAIIALLTALADSDEDVASGAAVALGRAGDPIAAEALLGLLGDEKRQQPVREAAALALGLLGGGDAAAVDARTARRIRRELERVAAERSGATRLRASAVYGLGLRGGQETLPFLVDAALSAESQWDVPAAAVSALGLTGEQVVRMDLEAMLAGPNRRRDRETVRRVYAAHGLARLGDAGAVPALRRAAVDEDADVRRAALLALGGLALRTDRETADLLDRAVYRDRDRGCRNMAALSLGRIGPDGAERTLRHAYTKGDGLHQPFGALALGLLAREQGGDRIPDLLLRDLERRANADLRGALCIALGLAGSQAAVPALREIASDRGNPEVRAHAALALGLAGDTAAAPAIRALMADRTEPTVRREAALALGLLGDRESLAVLLAMVRDDSSVYLQGSAATALGRIGGRESAGALLDLLQDERRPGIARAMGAVGLGRLLDRSEGRGLAVVGSDLNWYVLTPTAAEILTIL